jgi:hypothetical protein
VTILHRIDRSRLQEQNDPKGKYHHLTSTPASRIRFDSDDRNDKPSLYIADAPGPFVWISLKHRVFLDNHSNLLFLREKGAKHDHGSSRWFQ